MMQQDFAGTLKDLRREMGYKTARSFYNSNGGVKFFGCTYRQYLHLESAKSVPGTLLAARIAKSLKLDEDLGRAKRFTSSYLSALLKDEPFYRLVMTSAGSKAAAFESFEELQRRFLARRRDETRLALTHTQSECLQEYENYWVCSILANDRELWDIDRLVAKTGFKPVTVKSALKQLVRHGLAEKKGELYRCPHAGKEFMHPAADENGKANDAHETFREHWDRMALEQQGETVLMKTFLTRASEAELRCLCPQISETMDAVGACSTRRGGPDTALFVLEARARKIMPL